MSNFQLPFQPIRSALYTREELFEGFDRNSPASFGSTRDFSIYRAFISAGGANSGDYLTTLMQSLHDNSITQALRAFLEKKKCVATMGGHDMARTDAAYVQMAELARALTRAGFLVASGGGPGAMEATHLGAACGDAPDDVLVSALQLLATEAALPKHLDKIVDSSGNPDPSLISQSHSWFKVALQANDLISRPSASLAIPTWRYGHEPSTPFASHIAKYFQNSIREDGLVSVGMYGIVFAPGKAGTIQEIFQSTTNNYYHQFGVFSPMVFLGVQYWTTAYPVMAVLQRLFTTQQLNQYVLVTDDSKQAVEFIRNSRISAFGVPLPTFSSHAATRSLGTTDSQAPTVDQ